MEFDTRGKKSYLQVQHSLHLPPKLEMNLFCLHEMVLMVIRRLLNIHSTSCNYPRITGSEIAHEDLLSSNAFSLNADVQICL